MSSSALRLLRQGADVVIWLDKVLARGAGLCSIEPSEHTGPIARFSAGYRAYGGALRQELGPLIAKMLLCQFPHPRSRQIEWFSHYCFNLDKVIPTERFLNLFPETLVWGCPMLVASFG